MMLFEDYLVPPSKILQHTSILQGSVYIREVLDNSNTNTCREQFRMSIDTFNSLCDTLRSRNLVLGTDKVSIEEAVGIFFMHSGACNGTKTSRQSLPIL